MVYRTELKLKLISKKFRKENKVEVKYLIKGFTKATDITFFEEILEQTKELDVSVQVNNVGMANFTKLNNHIKQQICDMTASYSGVWCFAWTSDI